MTTPAIALGLIPIERTNRYNHSLPGGATRCTFALRAHETLIAAWAFSSRTAHRTHRAPQWLPKPN